MLPASDLVSITCMCVLCGVCRYSAGAQANILWSAGVKDKSEVGQVISRLEAAGMPTLGVKFLVDIEEAPGRSRAKSLEQISLADLRRIAAGEVLELL